MGIGARNSGMASTFCDVRTTSHSSLQPLGPISVCRYACDYVGVHEQGLEHVCTICTNVSVFIYDSHDGSRVAMCTDHIKQGVHGYADVCE